MYYYTAKLEECFGFLCCQNSTDQHNPAEVFTINNERFEDIKKVFWEMNILSFKLEAKGPITDSSNTNITKQSILKTLHIIVKNICCSEMVVRYGFDLDQIKQLNELLRPEYVGMLDALIYNISNQLL